MVQNNIYCKVLKNFRTWDTFDVGIFTLHHVSVYVMIQQTWSVGMLLFGFKKRANAFLWYKLISAALKKERGVPSDRLWEKCDIRTWKFWTLVCITCGRSSLFLSLIYSVCVGVTSHSPFSGKGGRFFKCFGVVSLVGCVQALTPSMPECIL